MKDNIIKSLTKPNKIPKFINEIPGLTSAKSQAFLNTICSNGTYDVLEVGCYCGASSVAMLYNNDINLTVIDNWSEIETLPQNDNIEFKIISNTKEEFIKHTKEFDVNIVEGDIFSEAVYKKISQLNKFDIIFYDGPHDVESILTFLLLYRKFFKPNVILIIDDYNFETVQFVIDAFKNEIGVENIKYEKKIITDGESKEDYWNGLYICII